MQSATTAVPVATTSATTVVTGNLQDLKRRIIDAQALNSQIKVKCLADANSANDQRVQAATQELDQATTKAGNKAIADTKAAGAKLMQVEEQVAATIAVAQGAVSRATVAYDAADRDHAAALTALATAREALTMGMAEAASVYSNSIQAAEAKKKTTGDEAKRALDLAKDTAKKAHSKSETAITTTCTQKRAVLGQEAELVQSIKSKMGQVKIAHSDDAAARAALEAADAKQAEESAKEQARVEAEAKVAQAEKAAEAAKVAADEKAAKEAKLAVEAKAAAEKAAQEAKAAKEKETTRSKINDLMYRQLLQVSCYPSIECTSEKVTVSIAFN